MKEDASNGADSVWWDIRDVQGGGWGMVGMARRDDQKRSEKCKQNENLEGNDDVWGFS